MDPCGDDEIRRLLRLKRYELPPPGYFENFLHEFRRRRCDESLCQPRWRICFERARDFVVWHNLRPLKYTSAGIVAVVACAAVFSIRLYQHPDITQLAVQASPIPSPPSNTEKELEFAPPVFIPRFDVQSTLFPDSRDVPMLPVDLLRSDQFIQLRLERDHRERK
jgi:hypothetical protein